MATHQCNFTERNLDMWVRETLDDWKAHPDNIPQSGEAWALDRGGRASVPGLRMRLRLRKDADGWSLHDPIVGFYLFKKVNGKLANRFLGDRNTTGVDEARTAVTGLIKQLQFTGKPH